MYIPGRHPNACMFVRRRKRIEDEPLVPHGLIGQATEDTEQPLSQRSEIIPFPQIVAAIPDLTPSSTPAGPARQFSVPDAEPAKAAESVAPPSQIIAINSVRSSELLVVPNQPLREFPTRARVLVLQSVSRRLFKNARRYARSSAAIAGRWLVGATNEISRGAHLFSSEKFRLPAREVLHRAQSRGRRFRERVTGSVVVLQARIQPWLRRQKSSLLLRYRNATAKRVRVRLYWPAIPESWRPAATGARIRQLQARAQIPLARFRAGWTLQKQGFAADSRAWAALAMGAICAMLALTLISVVRHYASESLPSKQNFRQPNASDVSSTGPLTALPAPKPVPAAVVTNTPAARRSTAQAVKETAAAAAKNTAPKPRRKATVDDDYVAKDTYVVYDQHAPSH